MDIIATYLGYMGLAFMKNAGMYQMLLVANMIWCGLLSIPLLKQRLKWHNWFGMLLVATGLIIKAIPLLLPISDSKGLVSKNSVKCQGQEHLV